jgi:hypothetical protein
MTQSVDSSTLLTYARIQPLNVYDNQQQPIDDVNKRVLNRNYLHVKPNASNSIPVTTSITTSLVDSNGNLNNVTYNDEKLNDVKRTKSISRSLKSLFIRNGDKKHKRDQSMDSHNTFNSVNQDVQSGSYFI